MTSTLADLVSLTTDELRVLRRAGFVCEERRGEYTVFKLRFRLDGQRVRYLGTDRDFAQQVAVALRAHQHRRKTELYAKHIDRRERRLSRQGKREITPYLPVFGLYYHGSLLRFRGHSTDV